jgi:hypothetical protein
VYVVETSIVVASNESGDADEVAALLEHLATLKDKDEPDWRNAVELYMAAISGDRAEALRLSGGPLFKAPWTFHARAVTMALLNGIGPSQAILQQALDAHLADDPTAYHDAIFLACVLRRPDDADQYLASARESGNLSAHKLERVRLARRFAFDAQMSVADFVDQAVAMCGTRTDVLQLLNLEVPLLAAARSGSGDPIPAVPHDQKLVDARLAELAAARQHWVDELDRHQRGLSVLMRLADVEPGWPSYAAANAADVRSDDYAEPLNAVARRLRAPVLERVCQNLPNVALEWLMGRRTDIDIAGIDSLLAGTLGQPLPLKLAVALLTYRLHNKAFEQLAAEADDAEIADAVHQIVSSAALNDLDISSWWRLDDEIAAVPAADDPHHIVSVLSARMLETLADLLGINELPDDTQRSYFSFVIGSDFVAEDTGPNWELFSTLIPGMKTRIKKETGFAPPGCLVRADPYWRDTLRLLINDCQLKTCQLPTTGLLRLSDNASTGLTDPLTNQPVTHEEKAPDQHSWTPMQFLMRHVERFMRDHIAELVTPSHVWDYANLLGDEAVHWVGSDSRLFLTWLALIRRMAVNADLHDPDAVAHALAERTFGTVDRHSEQSGAADPAQPASEGTR